MIYVSRILSVERGEDQGPGVLAERALGGEGRGAAGEIGTDSEADLGPTAWMCCVTTAAPERGVWCAERCAHGRGLQRCRCGHLPASRSQDSPG